jgi:putative ABC transport system permease protein
MFSDLRFALRTLVRARGFSLVTIATVAIGVGANTAIFAAVQALFLRPLPYPGGERMVRLWEVIPPFRGTGSVSEEDFLDWKAQTRTLEDMVAVSERSFNLAVKSPERIVGLKVTDGIFRFLGVQPLLGRPFLPDDFAPGQPSTVVIGHGLWRRAFGGDPGIVGKKLDLSGASYTVVGVMPPASGFPGRPAEVWFPFVPRMADQRGSHYLATYGRLRPGVTLEQARADLDLIAQRLATSYPSTNTGRGVLIKLLREDLVGGLRPMTIMLALAVAFVLLIGCANIANLLLARATGRRGEIAVRVALGASRGQLVRQLLTESLLLVAVGGALGLVIAMWGVDALQAVIQVDRGLFAIHLDGRVLAFAASVAIFSAFLFGLVPALAASRPDLSGVLKESAARSTAARGLGKRALVVAEVALSVMLLVGAGLLMRSLSRVNDIPVGFNPDRLLTLQIALPESRYPDDAAVATFHQRLLERVSALPGVVSAGAVNFLPLSQRNTNGDFQIVGRPPSPPGQDAITEYLQASPRYFATMGMSLLHGRGLTDADRAGTPLVVVINDTLARRYFPAASPLGQRLKLGGKIHEIVGVVADVRRWSKTSSPVPESYLSLWQNASSTMSLAVRAASDPLALAAAVRAAVQSIDRSQAIFDLQTMDEIISDSVAIRRIQAFLLTLFAALALLLATLGIYGVMAYQVSQRTQEMGIRLALGARAGQIQRLVVREGMRLCALGLVLGALGAAALSSGLRTLVFGVELVDIPTYALVATLLATVGLLASWLPARKATRVEPTIALRTY